MTLGTEPFTQVQTEIDKKIGEIPPPNLPSGGGLTSDDAFKLGELQTGIETNQVTINEAQFSETSSQDAQRQSAVSSFTATKTGTLWIAIPSRVAQAHPELRINTVLAKTEVIASTPEFFLYSHPGVSGTAYTVSYTVDTRFLQVNKDIENLQREEGQNSQAINNNSTQIRDIRTITNLMNKKETDSSTSTVTDWFAGDFRRGGETEYTATFFAGGGSFGSPGYFATASDSPFSPGLGTFSPQNEDIAGISMRRDSTTTWELRFWIYAGVTLDETINFNGRDYIIDSNKFIASGTQRSYRFTGLPNSAVAGISGGSVVKFNRAGASPRARLEDLAVISHRSLLYTSIDPTNEGNTRPHAIIQYDTADMIPPISVVRNFFAFRIQDNKAEFFKSYFVPAGTQRETINLSDHTGHGAGGTYRVNLGTSPQVGTDTSYTYDRNVPTDNEEVAFTVTAFINERDEGEQSFNVPSTATRAAPATHRYTTGSGVNVADLTVFYENGTIVVEVENINKSNLAVNGGYLNNGASYQRESTVPRHLAQDVLWSTSDLTSPIKIAMLKYNDSTTKVGRWGFNINGTKGVLEWDKASTTENTELLSTNPSFPGSIQPTYIRELTTAITNDVLDSRLDTVRQHAEDQWAGQRTTTEEHHTVLKIASQVEALDGNGQPVLLGATTSTTPVTEVESKEAIIQATLYPRDVPVVGGVPNMNWNPSPTKTVLTTEDYEQGLVPDTSVAENGKTLTFTPRTFTIGSNSLVGGGTSEAPSYIPSNSIFPENDDIIYVSGRNDRNTLEVGVKKGVRLSGTLSLNNNNLDVSSAAFSTNSADFDLYHFTSGFTNRLVAGTNYTLTYNLASRMTPILAVDRPRALTVSKSTGTGRQSRFTLFNADFRTAVTNTRKLWTNAKPTDALKAGSRFTTSLSGAITLSGQTASTPRNIVMTWFVYHYNIPSVNTPTFVTAKTEILPIKNTDTGGFIVEIPLASFNSSPVILQTIPIATRIRIDVEVVVLHTVTEIRSYKKAIETNATVPTTGDDAVSPENSLSLTWDFNSTNIEFRGETV